MKTKVMMIMLLVAPFLVTSQTNSSVDFVAGIEYSYRTLKKLDNELITNFILVDRKKEV